MNKHSKIMSNIVANSPDLYDVWQGDPALRGPATVHTMCSGCTEDATVSRVDATVKVAGRTGDLLSDDGDLVTWDCPSCKYADSFDLTAEEPS